MAKEGGFADYVTTYTAKQQQQEQGPSGVCRLHFSCKFQQTSTTKTTTTTVATITTTTGELQ